MVEDDDTRAAVEAGQALVAELRTHQLLLGRVQADRLVLIAKLGDLVRSEAATSIEGQAESVRR